MSMICIQKSEQHSSNKVSHKSLKQDMSCCIILLRPLISPHSVYCGPHVRQKSPTHTYNTMVSSKQILYCKFALRSKMSMWNKVHHFYFEVIFRTRHYLYHQHHITIMSPTWTQMSRFFIY